MASMNIKRLAAVAALSTSVVLMGGAAFAAPGADKTAPTDQLCQECETGYQTTGLVPGPVSDAHRTARNTEADADRQIGDLRQSLS